MNCTSERATRLKRLVSAVAAVAAGSGLLGACGPAETEGAPRSEAQGQQRFVETNTRSALSAWESLALEGREVEHFPDLVTITTQADIVVVGEITAVQPGRIFAQDDAPAGGGVQYVLAPVTPNEVIRGTPVAPGPINLEIGPANLDSNITTEFKDLVGSEGIFFLRNKGEEARAMGEPSNVVAADSPFYRLVSSQGLLFNAGGVVEAPLFADYSQEFPANLEGQSFGDVLELVREAA